jgi:hypothetical protein
MTVADSELRVTRLIWPPSVWPATDRDIWFRARNGHGPMKHDNPAFRWSGPTIKNHENGYGRFLSWLHREGLLVEDETVAQRVTRERIVKYTNHLKAEISPVSVAAMIATLTLAAQAISPEPTGPG